MSAEYISCKSQKTWLKSILGENFFIVVFADYKLFDVSSITYVNLSSKYYN